MAEPPPGSTDFSLALGSARRTPRTSPRRLQNASPDRLRAPSHPSEYLPDYMDPGLAVEHEDNYLLQLTKPHASAADASPEALTNRSSSGLRSARQGWRSIKRFFSASPRQYASPRAGQSAADTATAAPKGHMWDMVKQVTGTYSDAYQQL